MVPVLGPIFLCVGLGPLESIFLSQIFSVSFSRLLGVVTTEIAPMTTSSKTVLLPEAGHPQGRSSRPFRVNFQSPCVGRVSCKGRPLASLCLSEPGRESWGESTLHILVSVSHPPLRLPVIPLSTRGQKGYCDENPILQLGAHHPILLQEADGVHSI